MSEQQNSNVINSSANNELTTAQRPSFLKEWKGAESYSQSHLAKYAKPFRLKIVQKNSDRTLREKFKEGDIIVTPDLVKLGDNNTAITFVPLSFFDMFMAINPYGANLPTVFERTTDPTSLLAKKAKAFKEEAHPKLAGKSLKYHVSLNFIVLLQGIPDYKDLPFHLYSTRGEYGYFQILVDMIQGRWNKEKVPEFGNRFRLVSGLHERGDNDWQGFDFLNDSVPYVETQEEFDKYERLSKETYEIIRSNQIDLDYEENEEKEAAGSTESTTKFG